MSAGNTLYWPDLYALMCGVLVETASQSSTTCPVLALPNTSVGASYQRLYCPAPTAHSPVYSSPHSCRLLNHVGGARGRHCRSCGQQDCPQHRAASGPLGGEGAESGGGNQEGEWFGAWNETPADTVSPYANAHICWWVQSSLVVFGGRGMP